MDRILFQPDTHTGRAGLGHQLRSSTKDRQRVEGVQGETGFLPLTGDNISARGRGTGEDVLKVILHEVCDEAAIFAAGPIHKSRDRQQAHLDGFS